MGNISELNNEYVDATVIKRSARFNVKVLNLSSEKRLNFDHAVYWKYIETDFSGSNRNQVFTKDPDFRVIKLSNILN